MYKPMKAYAFSSEKIIAPDISKRDVLESLFFATPRSADRLFAYLYYCRRYALRIIRPFRFSLNPCVTQFTLKDQVARDSALLQLLYV